MLMSVVFLIEFFSFAAFFIIEKQRFSFSRINSERKSLSYEADILKSASVEETYNFLDNLGSADIITNKTNYENGEPAFAINNIR